MVAASLLLPGCVGSGGSTSQTAGGIPVTVLRVDGARYPIVYSQPESESLDLYLTTVEGAAPVQFTQGPADEVMPSWSPDGSRVAFVVTKDLDQGPSDIYVVGADGQGLRLLTPGEECATNPSWSSNGAAILYLSAVCGPGNSASVFVMDSGGGRARPIIAGPTAWPDWSSDGRIVYEGPSGPGQSAMFITDTTGKHPQMIDTGRLPSGSEMTWSPDGRQIAYVAGMERGEDPEQWNEDIFVVSVDGPGRRIVSTPGNDHWPPAWSPDGRQLLYTADGPGNASRIGNLTLVDLQTRRLRPLFRLPCQCFFPDWRR